MAITYYVDGKNGLDTHAGTSLGTAFKTIGKAVSLLPTGAGAAAGYQVLIQGYNDYVYRERPINGQVLSGATGTGNALLFQAIGYANPGVYTQVCVDGSAVVNTTNYVSMNWTLVSGTVYKTPWPAALSLQNDTIGSKLDYTDTERADRAWLNSNLTSGNSIPLRRPIPAAGGGQPLTIADLQSNGYSYFFDRWSASGAGICTTAPGGSPQTIGTLYVNLAQNSTATANAAYAAPASTNPASNVIEMPYQSTWYFDNACSYVTCQGLRAWHSDLGFVAKGGCNNMTFQGCDARHNFDMGFIFDSNGAAAVTNCLVDRCTASNNAIQAVKCANLANTITISNSHFFQNCLQDGCDLVAGGVHGITITNNVINGGNLIPSYNRYYSTLAAYKVTGILLEDACYAITITGNAFINQSTGIATYISGSAQQSLGAGAASPTHGGDFTATITGNVFRNETHISSDSGFAISFGSPGAADEAACAITFTGNTVTNCDGGGTNANNGISYEYTSTGKTVSPNTPTTTTPVLASTSLPMVYCNQQMDHVMNAVIPTQGAQLLYTIKPPVDGHWIVNNGLGVSIGGPHLAAVVGQATGTVNGVTLTTANNRYNLAYMYAFDPMTGAPLWNSGNPPNLPNTPQMDGNVLSNAPLWDSAGNSYTADNNYFASFDSSGNLRWRTQHPAYPFGQSPGGLALTSNGYLVTHARELLLVLDPASGTLMCTYALNDTYNANSAIPAQGTFPGGPQVGYWEQTNNHVTGHGTRCYTTTQFVLSSSGTWSYDSYPPGRVFAFDVDSAGQITVAWTYDVRGPSGGSPMVIVAPTSPSNPLVAGQPTVYFDGSGAASSIGLGSPHPILFAVEDHGTSGALLWTNDWLTQFGFSYIAGGIRLTPTRDPRVDGGVWEYATDDTHIYQFDARTGAVLQTLNLSTMFQSGYICYGPQMVVSNNNQPVLLLCVGHFSDTTKPVYIAAIDLHSSTLLWAYPTGNVGTGQGTPNVTTTDLTQGHFMLAQSGGKTVLVFALNNGKVLGLALTDSTVTPRTLPSLAVDDYTPVDGSGNPLIDPTNGRLQMADFFLDSGSAGHVLWSPYGNSAGVVGETPTAYGTLLRYDTDPSTSFKTPAQWKASDLPTITGNAAAVGFGGTFLDHYDVSPTGVYTSMTPGGAKKAYFPAFRKIVLVGGTPKAASNTVSVRVDLAKLLLYQGTGSENLAYEVFDYAGHGFPHTGWFHGTFCAGHAYFAPTTDNTAGPLWHSIAARYNTLGDDDYTNAANHEYFDMAALNGVSPLSADGTPGNTACAGYQSACNDGRYVYFLPFTNGVFPNNYGSGMIVRYDTTEPHGPATFGSPFKNPANWEFYDLQTQNANAKGFTGGFVSGGKLVLVPFQNQLPGQPNRTATIAACFDLSYGTLNSAAGWSFLDLTTLSPLTLSAYCGGYQFGWVDRNGFIWFGPMINYAKSTPPPYIVYDPQQPFTNVAAWKLFALRQGAVPNTAPVTIETGVAYDPRTNISWMAPFGVFADAGSGLHIGDIARQTVT